MSARAGGSRPHPPVRDSDVRADWEERIYRRLTETAVADRAGTAGARAAAGHRRRRARPAELGSGARRGRVRDRAGQCGRRRAADPAARRERRARRRRDRRSRTPASTTAPTTATGWARSAEPERVPRGPGQRPAIGQYLRRSAGVSSRVGVDAGTVTGQLDRVWRMVGSERLSQLRLGRRPRLTAAIAAEFAAALGSRTTTSASPLRARARHPARRQRASCTGATTARCTSTSAASTPSTTSCSRSACGRSSSCRSCRPRWPATRSRRSSPTAASSRRRADWAEWRDAGHRAHRAPGGPLRRRRGRRVGVRGVERAQPRGVLDRHASRTTCGCTTSRRARSSRSTRGCGSAGRRPQRPSGSSRWPSTPRSSDLPLDFVSTHTYGNLPARLPARAAPARLRPASRSGGRSGASARRTSARCTTASSVRRSC